MKSLRIFVCVERPAPIGREEREYSESPNAVPSQRRSHGYQNHPDRQTSKMKSVLFERN